MIAPTYIARATTLSDRRTKRRVPCALHDTWQDLALRAVTEHRWILSCRHGGTVANAYGYAAVTECVVAAASPDGRVVLWYGAVPANKATTGGAAAACVGRHARPIWDARYGEDATGVAREYLIAQARAVLGYGPTSDDPTSARFELLELDEGARQTATSAPDRLEIEID